MYLKVRAFVPGLIEVLGLLVSILSLAAGVYSNIPKEETWYGTVQFKVNQAVSFQDLNFNPSNGYWYVGMGNETEQNETFTILKYEGNIWKPVSSTTTLSANSIEPPQLVRKNNAIFGWNGTQKLRVVWGSSSSNSNLTVDALLVTDIKKDGRLPFMGIPTKYNKWGWK